MPTVIGAGRRAIEEVDEPKVVGIRGTMDTKATAQCLAFVELEETEATGMGTNDQECPNGMNAATG